MIISDFQYWTEELTDYLEQQRKIKRELAKKEKIELAEYLERSNARVLHDANMKK